MLAWRPWPPGAAAILMQHAMVCVEWVKLSTSTVPSRMPATVLSASEVPIPRTVERRRIKAGWPWQVGGEARMARSRVATTTARGNEPKTEDLGQTHALPSPEGGAPVSPAPMTLGETEKARVVEIAGRVSLVKDWRSILTGLFGENVKLGDKRKSCLGRVLAEKIH